MTSSIQQSRRHLKASAILLAALATACFASHAEAPLTAPAVTIRYDDLNLSAEAGAQVLQRRIRSAASRVCGRPRAYDIQGSADYRRCLQDTTEHARAQVRWPDAVVVNDQ